MNNTEQYFSATIDVDRFAEYFEAPGPVLDIPAPIILVDGQNYTVEVTYDADITTAVNRYGYYLHYRICSKYALAAARKIQEIIEARETGDVLVFLPGQVAF